MASSIATDTLRRCWWLRYCPTAGSRRSRGPQSAQEIAAADTLPGAETYPMNSCIRENHRSLAKMTRPVQSTGLLRRM